MLQISPLAEAKEKSLMVMSVFELIFHNQKKNRLRLLFLISPKMDATIQIHITHATMQHIQLYKSLFYSPTVNMETLVEEQKKHTLKTKKNGLGTLNRKKKNV